MVTLTLVRRWRSGRATLSLHERSCPSVKRAEIADFIRADTSMRAHVLASQRYMSEVTVGRSNWGAECSRCNP